jgi:beta-lactamase superfamily II metal-dependent hydrolase
MNYFSTVSETELSYYCEEILSAGFEKISEREEKGNKFFTYLSDKAYVYVYYTAHSKDLRVLSGPAHTLASADYSSDLARDKVPFIASIPQPDSGQGYILRLPDGRYLIHDGGYENDDRVYAALRELQPEGDIVIAAWFISHPHGDHYPAFVDFIKDHYKDKTIKIERVIYNFTAAERYNVDGSAGVEWGGIGVRKFHEAMEQYAPDLPLIKAHTGQVMDFGSAKVEILLTVEDIMPAEMNNTNDSSMVIRVEMGGSSIMLLADTCYASGPKLNKMWGDYLKSDIVQVAHHGMWPSVAEIYHSIKAEVLLYSTTYNHLRYHIKETAQWGDVNKVILQYAKDIYVSDSKIEKIMLPYTVQNNKDQMLDYIINYK